MFSSRISASSLALDLKSASRCEQTRGMGAAVDSQLTQEGSTRLELQFSFCFLTDYLAAEDGACRDTKVGPVHPGRRQAETVTQEGGWNQYNE